MPWFKVDDSFHSHPKAMAAGPAALGLWVIAGSWSGANLTDGFVPDYVLPRLAEGARELADTLVTSGLWRRAKGGFRFHDWGVYQPSKEEVLEERKKWAEKKAKQRAAKQAKHYLGSSDGFVSPGDTPGESSGGVPRESRSSRSRPRSSPKGEENASEVDAPDASHRPDVERLCTHLADRIEANGSKRPEIGQRWYDAARLLLDKDRRTEEQVRAAIDWSQNDQFWCGVVMSMPKLREKYDQLRLQARRVHAGGEPDRQQPRRSTTDERVAAAQALKHQPSGGTDQSHPLMTIMGELE